MLPILTTKGLYMSEGEPCIIISQIQASDRETLTNSALEGAYSHLYKKWLPESGYTMTEMLTAEVYIEDRMEAPVNPEMELWQPIMRK